MCVWMGGGRGGGGEKRGGGGGGGDSGDEWLTGAAAFLGCAQTTIMHSTRAMAQAAWRKQIFQCTANTNLGSAVQGGMLLLPLWCRWLPVGSTRPNRPPHSETGTVGGIYQSQNPPFDSCPLQYCRRWLSAVLLGSVSRDSWWSWPHQLASILTTLRLPAPPIMGAH